MLLPRIKLAPNNSDFPFILQLNQFPVRLAYSMTINKAQGQSDRIGIYLPKPMVFHGQLHVVFSRARVGADVKVEVYDTSQQGRRE